MNELKGKPIVLKAITLRGIGSYLHGERLDIRPLTILCGTNGSGKSTWFSILNLLRKSSEKGCLPFSLDDKAHPQMGLSLAGRHTNSFAELFADEEGSETLHDFKARTISEDGKFGPLGTIGLETEVFRDDKLPHELPTTIKQSPLQAFFYYGQCRKGMQFRIRLTIPADRGLAQEQIIELAIKDEAGDRPVIQFIKNGTQHYDVFLSNELILPEQRTQPLVRLSKITPDESSAKVKIEPCDGCSSPDSWKELSDLAVKRICQLLERVLDGCFYLGAIRKIVSDWEVWDEDGEHVKNRYVGADGSKVHSLYWAFRGNQMKQARKPFDGYIRDIGFGKKYIFDTYCNEWLKNLLDISLNTVFAVSGAGEWMKNEPMPNGYLVESVPNAQIRLEGGGADIYHNPCFEADLPVTPVRMSAGFHQVAPMIVQSGLIARNEMLCIENPEVHLHPALQSKITEFFINEANTGKYIVIETHSDLVVLRTLRAILQEEIPQEWVRVYFSSLKKQEDSGRAYSKLEQIKIDEQGRIAEWPKGFMDTDMIEFERFMNAIYKNRPEDCEGV